MKTMIGIAIGALFAIGVGSFEARNPSLLDMDKYNSSSISGMFGSVFTIVPKSPVCPACMPDFWD